MGEQPFQWESGDPVRVRMLQELAANAPAAFKLLHLDSLPVERLSTLSVSEQQPPPLPYVQDAKDGETGLPHG